MLSGDYSRSLGLPFYSPWHAKAKAILDVLYRGIFIGSVLEVHGNWYRMDPLEILSQSIIA